jgi:small subunit ribosomal protein S4
MGDPRKPKKSYAKPFKVWDENRIAAEKELLTAYGLKNKKEIWRTSMTLRRFQAQAKSLIVRTGEQAEKERQQLLTRLASLGLVDTKADLDTVLGLTIKNILERRLQTLLFNKKLARSITQARQFIIHEHVLVNGKRISVPSYLVRKKEEDGITFAQESPLAKEDHPERAKKEVGTPEVDDESKTVEKKDDRKEPAPADKKEKTEQKEEKKSEPKKEEEKKEVNEEVKADIGKPKTEVVEEKKGEENGKKG